MTTFNFKAYGARKTEPTEKQKYIDFKPMNCRYMSEPVTVGNRKITIEVTAYEYDEYAAFNIYEEDENGSIHGNIDRMINAGLWKYNEFPGGHNYIINKTSRPMYRPTCIAEAVQRLYPEVKTAITFEDLEGTWSYSPDRYEKTAINSIANYDILTNN